MGTIFVRAYLFIFVVIIAAISGDMRRFAVYLRCRYLGWLHGRRSKGVRAKILQIGTVHVDSAGHVFTSGWVFDRAFASIEVGMDGRLRLGGYTSKELQEVIARRAEWEGAYLESDHRTEN